MTRFKRLAPSILIIAIANLSIVNSVFASDREGQKAPSLNLNKQGLSQVGSAKFTVLFWDIYQSALYSPTGQFNEEIHIKSNKLKQPLLFEIQYLRDISVDDLLARTIEQWQHLGMEDKDYAPYLPQLKKIWPDIKKGDRLALLLQQDSSIFYFNDRFAGDINNPLFGQQFLAIWLAENTSQPKLRRQLIGASN